MLYRELLKKYMKNVGIAEGVYFIPYEPDQLFTQEEIDELNLIREELDKTSPELDS